MSQTFSPKFDQGLRLGCVVGLIAGLTGMVMMVTLVRSSWVTRRHMTVDQPISFSHRHHAGKLGIDCRYCHTSVETSADAGMPSTQTCMTCHSQLFTDSKMLKPVRDSWTQKRPIAWKRVNELPDFVYFAHNVHVQNGVACTECHGRVDRMAALTPPHTFTMGFCLECHRDPGQRLRPRKEVANPAWHARDEDREKLADYLMKEYRVELTRLTQCTTCHR